MTSMNEPKWVDINCVGEQTPTNYFGKFLVKPFLTRRESADAVRLAELYSRGIDDPFERSLLRLMAFLKFHVVEAEAKWWDSAGLELLDERPIYALSEELGKLRVAINPALAGENTPATKAPTDSADK